MGVLVSITQGLNLVTAFGPVAIEIALGIRKLLQGADSGEAYDVQIARFKNGTLQILDDTDAEIAEWLAAHK